MSAYDAPDTRASSGSIFLPQYWSSNNDTNDTKYDSKYLKLVGGTISGSLTAASAYVQNLTVTGKTTSFTVFPTLTSQDVGYSVIYTRGTNINPGSNVPYKVCTPFDLPVGVWRLDMIFILGSTGGTAGNVSTWTRAFWGYNNVVTAGNAATAVGWNTTTSDFQGEDEKISWVLQNNDTATWTRRHFSQTLIVTSPLTGVYGYVGGSFSNGTSTMALISASSFVKATRIA